MLVNYKSTFGKILTPEEAPHAMRESEHKATDQYRLENHKERQQSWRKRGYMHASEFILRIKRINPSLFVQQQTNFPDDWGFYADVHGKLTYLSGFKKGWVPEYSFTVPDKQDLDVQEVRGWRTCLVRLLNYGVVTWAQVQREFGDAVGIGGWKWRKDTRKHRNFAGTRVVDKNLRNKLVA